MPTGREEKVIERRLREDCNYKNMHFFGCVCILCVHEMSTYEEMYRSIVEKLVKPPFTKKLTQKDLEVTLKPKALL